MLLKINKLLIVVLRTIYLLQKVNWLQLYRLHNANADTVFWLFYDEKDGILKGILKGDFLRQFAMLQALISMQKPFHIVVGREIGNISNKKIVYNIGRYFNLFGLQNHSATLLNVLEQLEKQGNEICPSLHEAKHWENKIWMHEQFKACQVNEPTTLLHSISKAEGNNALPEGWNPPFLVKDPHSAGSGGVYKVNSTQEYGTLVADLQKNGVEKVIIQTLLNIRRDMRVIIIDGEIVLHYWRINLAKEWKPTSTSHGSNVDFISFPEQWREYILATYRRLNIRLAAFDVLWDNDDLETTPIFLEVSPSFQPNPPQPARYANIPYYEFKQKVWGNDTYYRKFIDIVFDFKYKEIIAYFKS